MRFSGSTYEPTARGRPDPLPRRERRPAAQHTRGLELGRRPRRRARRPHGAASASYAVSVQPTVVTRPRELGEEIPDDLAGEQARALLVLDNALLLESEAAIVGGRPAAHALVAYDNGEYDLTLEQ